MSQQILPWLGLAAVAAYIYITQAAMNSKNGPRLKTATGKIDTGAEDQILTMRARLQEEALFGNTTMPMELDDRNVLPRPMNS